jgi:hypothetical protein
MDFDDIEQLQKSHPAWRLLRADHAPLILSFLYGAFIRPNRRAIPQTDLVARLEDHLHHLRTIHGDDRFPRDARHYLDDWSQGAQAYLRKYYPDLGDEPEYDVTPAVERVVEWLQSLTTRQFVGTESRLLTVFQLLQDIVQNASADGEARLQALQRQREALDVEMARVAAGILPVFDTTRIKERFMQAEETARRLLSDFGQVEENFRLLDRATRTRMAAGDQGRGQVLDAVFQEWDIIGDSDQGRSFRAFWEFLLTPERQEELQRLLEAVYDLDAVQDLQPTPFLRLIRYSLLERGGKVHRTGHQLTDQLRRFVDDQAHLENRRILELIRDVERAALAVAGAVPADAQPTAVDAVWADIDLPLERGLFHPVAQVRVESGTLEAGEADIDLTALHRQLVVDLEALRANVRQALQAQPRITLAELVTRFPLSLGLAELVGYVTLAHQDPKALIADDQRESVVISQSDGSARTVRLPLIMFCR